MRLRWDGPELLRAGRLADEKMTSRTGAIYGL